jgi:hypothetical protein
MAIIACSAIAVIMCWVIRWEHPLSDIETATIGNKQHRSTLSIGSMMMVANENPQSSVAPFNPNASCTSVLTCVEPSLRDI